MKQFFVKGIACLALFVVIDLVIGYTHEKIFGNLPDKISMVSTIYYSLFKKSADVLILGSSTANHHYNSKIMEDSLGMSVYNAGLDGRDMIYFDVVLQSVLERQIPKYVILDIGDVHLNGNWIDRIGDTKLYYKKNNAVTHYYIEETDWQQQLKLISSTYRYNKTLSYLIRVGLDKPNTLNGYAPLFGNRASFEWTETNSFTVDSTELIHLNHFVSLCDANNIKLIFVQSPQSNDNMAFDNWINDYAYKNGVTLIKENKEQIFLDCPELFYDGGHLNTVGAEIFTGMICHRISCYDQ